MNSAWQLLADECARWHALGRPVRFWWRDDDATRPTPELTRLAALAEAAEVPLALAVIPELAQPALFEWLGASVDVLQHGCDHRNRAEPGEKKCEFPVSEPVEAALGRLRLARERLAAVSVGRALPVLVPPWNRISGALAARLPEIGVQGLSRFGLQTTRGGVRELLEFNTHVDLVAWRSGRGFAGEAEVLGQAVRVLSAWREGHAAPSLASREALGWLTHHACHDEAAWTFLQRLFEFSRSRPGIRWISAREMFDAAQVA